MAERLCVLDTETTGLSQSEDCIIEIGVVELEDRVPTGRVLHEYFKPKKRVDAGAVKVHGLTNEFLADKPKFVERVEVIKDFLVGSTVIIHNAPFDVGFIDSEFSRLQDDWRMHKHCEVVDTLLMARQRFPGMSNSLDSLCTRFGVDSQHRTLHGALLDAELLMQVYLAMTRTQHSFVVADQSGASSQSSAGQDLSTFADQAVVREANSEEQAAHREMLEKLREDAGQILWDEIEGSDS